MGCFTAARRLLRSYSEHGASELAALLTYYGFLALFPMLLAGVTVLGIVLRHDPGLQQKVLTSSLVEFPVIGEDLRTNVQSLPGVTGLVTGLVLGLLGARGFCLGLQRTVETVWAVPHDERPSWLSAQLRTFKLIAVAGAGVVVSTALTAATTTSLLRLLFLLLVLPGTGLLLLGALRVIAPDVVPTRDLAVAAAVGAVGLVAMQAVGSQLVQHMTTSRAVYGAFAAVLGLLAWIHLQVQVVVIALEVGHQSGSPSPEPTPVSDTRSRVRREPRPTGQESVMGKGTVEELKGHAKRAAGKVLDDDELRNEGEAQADKGREERRADEHEAKAKAAEVREHVHQEMK